jgi:hypothetical protein
VRRVLPSAGWIALGLIGPLVFLVAELASRLWGFPLDDAWIHQTYARSLAAGLGWSYVGGSQTAGSTSPLWTFFQVPSFWLNLSPILWSYSIGILLLLINAALIMLWIRKIDPGSSRLAFLFCLGEWHLVWAALSGMETMLYCAWIALMLFLFFPVGPRPASKGQNLPGLFLLGLLTGTGIWIRPEAVLLSGITVLAVLYQWRPVHLGRAGGFLIGVLLPILLFFGFTYHLNGRLLPNTFFVKTTEYSSLTSGGLLSRLVQPWIPLLAGPLAVLILFIPAALIEVIRSRKWILGLPFLWAVGHLVLYAVQLPAAYQHGRYFIPVLPVLIGYGVWGYILLRHRLVSGLLSRVVVRALGASAGVLAVIFLGIGAGQFVRDVDLIDRQMVAVSIWIRDNTPPGTVVAAHDIGALGFFGERPIVDLGGVTDLEAMDLLSGKVRLPDYLRRKGAEVLMTMPDFYPGELVHCAPLAEFQCNLSPAECGRRTAVYSRWEGCAE